MGKKQPKYEDFADAAAWEADEEEYGSAWVTDQETRRDTDGHYYTKDEFIEFYGGTTEWDQAPSRCILNAAGPAAADPTPTDTHPPAVMQHSSEMPVPLGGADAPPTVSLDEYLTGSRQKAVAPTAQSGVEGGAGSYWGPVDVASRTGTVRLPANCFVVCTACGARHSQIDPGCADCGEAIGVARRECSRIGSVWGDPAEWLPSELWLRVIEQQSVLTLCRLAAVCRSLRHFVTVGTWEFDRPVRLGASRVSPMLDALNRDTRHRLPPWLLESATPSAVLQFSAERCLVSKVGAHVLAPQGVVSEQKTFLFSFATHALVFLGSGLGAGKAVNVVNTRSYRPYPPAADTSLDVGMGAVLAMAISTGPSLWIYLSLARLLRAYHLTVDGEIEATALGVEVAEIPVVTTLTVHHNAGGEPVGVYASTRDKTARCGCVLLHPASLAAQRRFDVAEVSAISCCPTRVAIAHSRGVTLWAVTDDGAVSDAPLKTLESFAGCVALGLSSRALFAVKPGTTQVRVWGGADDGQGHENRPRSETSGGEPQHHSKHGTKVRKFEVNMGACLMGVQSEHCSLDGLEVISETACTVRLNDFDRRWVSSVVLVDTALERTKAPEDEHPGSVVRQLTSWSDRQHIVVAAGSLIVGSSEPIRYAGTTAPLNLMFWDQNLPHFSPRDKPQGRQHPFKQITLPWQVNTLRAMRYDHASGIIFMIAEDRVLACPFLPSPRTRAALPPIDFVVAALEKETKEKAVLAAQAASRRRVKDTTSGNADATEEYDPEAAAEAAAARGEKIQARQKAKAALQQARQRQGKKSQQDRSHARNAKRDT
eukprot:m.470920 g.470920  ORF g.470920 m.470920 type:complete len:822 (+) comp30430_c0_seq1:176-2641(+)